VRGVFDCSNSGVIISNPTGARKTEVHVPKSFYALKKPKPCNETVFFPERCTERQAHLALWRLKVKVLFCPTLFDFRNSTAFCKAHRLHLSVLVNETARRIVEYWQANAEVSGDKPVPVPLCPIQISHQLTWNGNRVSVVRGQRLPELRHVHVTVFKEIKQHFQWQTSFEFLYCAICLVCWSICVSQTHSFWRWRQYVSPKRSGNYTAPTKTEETAVVCVTTAMKSWNLTYNTWHNAK